MRERRVADFLLKLDEVLAGTARFDDLRAFVFAFYDSEDDIRADEALEELLSVVAPYFEHEEAFGDVDRVKRLERLRSVLPGDSLGTRAVFALELDRIVTLVGSRKMGAISNEDFEQQLGKLSPGRFDVARLATWALEHEAGPIVPSASRGKK